MYRYTVCCILQWYVGFNVAFYIAFDGLLWPARFVGFAIGIGTYAIGVWLLFKEGITVKTFISLILCVILISIQVLWKTE